MLTRFRFDSGRVARKGFVGTVTVKQASGQPDKNPQDSRFPRLYAAPQLQETGAEEKGDTHSVKIDIYCPVCAAAGINHGKGRLLMQVDSSAKGVVYPYCKGCKKNVKIELKGEKSA